MYKGKIVRSIAAVLVASIIFNVPFDIKAITKSEQEQLECNKLLKNKRTDQGQQNQQKIEDLQNIAHEYENMLKLKKLKEKKNNLSKFSESDLDHDELVENPEKK